MSKKPFIVYAHTHNGQVFYIGSGAASRANNFHNRGVVWMHYFVLFEKRVTTHLIHESNSREFCYILESALIRVLQPIANLSGHKDKTSNRKRSDAAVRVAKFLLRRNKLGLEAYPVSEMEREEMRHKKLIDLVSGERY